MPEPLFPVTYSLVAPDALLDLIAHNYPLSELASCRLHRVSWNSTYLLFTRDLRFVVRVYGATWRSRSEIRYEIDLLLHLAACGCGVASPIARTDNDFITPIPAPEGMRYAVVFTYAPGTVPLPFPLGDARQSEYFGRALAELHTAADSFTSSESRVAHTTTNMIDRSLEMLKPFFMHRTADWKYLQHVATVVHDQLDTRVHGLTWGVIHGDPFSANATLSNDNRVTWYDFDLCGPGWHLSDVADGYASAMGQERSEEEKDAIWQSFLRGYRSKRTLNNEHVELIPVMLAASTIRFMCVNAQKSLIQGQEYWGSDEFLDEWMQYARNWMQRVR
jgi:Ser/Thr protein kinase RdoA (MazF antagonist)